jgi:uncharacterized Zn finger protein
MTTNTQQQQPAAAVLHYCSQCGKVTEHQVHDDGHDEMYRCRECGRCTWYRVR